MVALGWSSAQKRWESQMRNGGTQHSDASLCGELERAEVMSLMREVVEKLRKEKTVLQLHGSTAVIGDIHGHWDGLCRVLSETGVPPDRQLLFLGNLINYGDESLRVLTYVMRMKVANPRRVWVLRGARESGGPCRGSGLHEELRRQSRSVWRGGRVAVFVDMRNVRLFAAGCSGWRKDSVQAWGNGRRDESEEFERNGGSVWMERAFRERFVGHHAQRSARIRIWVGTGGRRRKWEWEWKRKWEWKRRRRRKWEWKRKRRRKWERKWERKWDRKRMWWVGSGWRVGGGNGCDVG
jgi:hypothetical protein